MGCWPLGPVHTNPFSNENGAVLLRFQKDSRPHLSFSYRFRPSTLQRSSREKPHGTVCSPFWILTVEWAGARSCPFGWRHRFQIASFSPSTPENSVFKKDRFQIAPLWRAFSKESVFGDRFRRCSMDDRRIRSKTAPFSFENGLVGTGLKSLRALGPTVYQVDKLARVSLTRRRSLSISLQYCKTFHKTSKITTTLERKCRVKLSNCPNCRIKFKRWFWKTVQKV